MLTKRIIACLDVKDGRVVKGVQFKAHEDMGDIVELAEFYSRAGIDELVFYDIVASTRKERVSRAWVSEVAKAARTDLPTSPLLLDLANLLAEHQASLSEQVE